MRVRMAGEGAEEFDKLRKTVRSVLLSSPKGVQLKKFCADYRGLVKETFPWKRLGTCLPLFSSSEGVIGLLYT